MFYIRIPGENLKILLYMIFFTTLSTYFVYDYKKSLFHYGYCCQVSDVVHVHSGQFQNIILFFLLLCFGGCNYLQF